MTVQELVHLSRRISLKNKKRVYGARIGTAATRSQAFGIEFQELRDYQLGDNVRAIDWKSSARHHKLMVRSYRQEFNRQIYIIADVSRSLQGAPYREALQSCALLLAGAAYHAQDDVGLLLFSHELERVVKPGSGIKQLVKLFSLFESATFPHKQGSFEPLIPFLTALKERSLLIMLTDGYATGLDRFIQALGSRHELMMVRLYDGSERDLPAHFLFNVEDPELGLRLHTAAPGLMHVLQRDMQRWKDEQDALLRQARVLCADINVQGAYHEELISAFR